MEWNRYRSIVEEFDLILAHAKAAMEAIVGMRPGSDQERYAAEIFVKLLAHCVTLRSLSPDPSRQREKELWDLPSAAAIARCIVETFDAMAYVAARSAPAVEREFRVLLWELHDSNRRARTLEALGSTSEGYLAIVAKDQQLHKRVLDHPYFPSLPKRVQKSVVDRDPPDCYLSIREQCEANGVSHSYYTAVMMHLSQYVHTYPFSIHQLFRFRGGSNESLHLMALPLQYSMAFVSRAVEEFRALFPKHTPDAGPEARRKIDLWVGLVARGTRT